MSRQRLTAKQRDFLGYASWLIFGPQCEWSWRALLAARYQPCKTLIRGRPWEDTQ